MSGIDRPSITKIAGDKIGLGKDRAQKNACYLLFKWIDDSTILNADEMHKRVKEIWDGGGGFGGTTGAKDSSNTTIRSAVRSMLEAEVAGDVPALTSDATTAAEECKRVG